MSYMEVEYLQLSGIQHFAYCPRQWALIHIEQVWAENAKTVKGDLFHKNVDNHTSIEKRNHRLIQRSVRVSSPSLGISGICDVVEYELVEGTDQPICCFPIEYKVGRKKLGLEDKAQLCAEVMCLEEMHNITIPYAYIYYGQERRRTKVDIDDDLKRVTTQAIEEMHAYFQKGVMPSASYSVKCKNCSLIDLCMPPKDMYLDVQEYIKRTIFESS